MQTPETDRERGSSSRGYSYTPSQTKNKQLEQILDTLYRRRLIIIVALVVVTAGALFYSLTLEPEYQASALIMIELERAPSGASGALEEGTPFVRSDRSLATELFILQNDRDIHRRVYERLKEMAASDPSVTYPPKGRVAFGPANRMLDNALQVLATSPSPREAVLLADIYAEEYVRQTKDVSRTYLTQTQGFLEEQAEQRQAELQAAEDEVQTFMEANQAEGLTESGASVVSKIASLEAQREAAELDRQMRQAQMATTEEALNEISPQLAQLMVSDTDRRVAELQTEVARLEAEKQQIFSIETRVNGLDAEATRQKRAADLADLDRRIAAARAEALTLSESYVQEALGAGGVNGGPGAVSYAVQLRQQMVSDNITLEGINARIDMMNRQVGAMQSDLSQIPGQSTELARLERTRQQAEQMYQYVVQRLQETEIAQQSEPGYARILREASIGAPSGQSRWSMIALGLLLGLALGVGFAFVRDKLDNRIYKPDQLRDRDQNVIGVIPNMEPHIKQAYGGDEVTEHRGDHVATSLTTLLDPMSAAAEAYRHLRTAVQFSRPGVIVQTVLVTSAAPSEGKSTTAANLAMTMAQAKRRTLLIDADIRRPKQHHLFGRELEPGLVQVLTDGDLTAEAFQTSLDQNLYVMPAGGLLDNGFEDQDFTDNPEPTLVESPSELIGSKRMRDVLEMLRGQFDMIIIDTPPVLAATEAVLLSTQADATIIVAAAGKTKEGDLDHSLERLSDVGAHVIGTLLNRFDLSLAYGYKYSYGVYGPYSKYSYGPGEEQPEPWWKLSRWSQKA